MSRPSKFHVQPEIISDVASVKTIIILSYGWISEGRPMTVKDAAGIMLALGGASLYSQLSSG